MGRGLGVRHLTVRVLVVCLLAGLLAICLTVCRLVRLLVRLLVWLLILRILRVLRLAVGGLLPVVRLLLILLGLGLSLGLGLGLGLGLSTARLLPVRLTVLLTVILLTVMLIRLVRILLVRILLELLPVGLERLAIAAVEELIVGIAWIVEITHATTIASARSPHHAALRIRATAAIRESPPRSAVCGIEAGLDRKSVV